MKNGSVTLCPSLAVLVSVFPDGNLRMSEEKNMMCVISMVSTLNFATSWWENGI